MKIIYLLGAGRSGTTAISAVLDSNERISTIGEMHQFIEHMEGNKRCACGAYLDECEYWSEIIKELTPLTEDASKIIDKINAKESHKNIPKLLLRNSRDTNYLSVQHQIFAAIHKRTNSDWLLDSSKFISRFLLLKKSKKLTVKGIYIVRDVRGVINSFGKQVQTRKSPLNAIAYYLLINCFGQIVCWLHKDVMKIRYEDFVKQPESVVEKIYKHILENSQEVKSLSDFFEMPHIIGGNRMKSKQKIVIRNDDEWKQKMTRFQQIWYYFLGLPIMVINRYKI